MTDIEVAPGVRIDEVRVGERARKDYGDLTSLKDSILEHGLLQPIVLLPDQHLLCGGRRLEACRQLGWESIPFVVSRSQTDALAQLKAERDENTCRKAMTPSEMVAIGIKIEELTRPAAVERQADGRRLGGEIRQGSASRSADREAGRDTRDEVADALGLSGAQYSRMKRVVGAAEDESLDDETRIVALEAQEQMDKGEISVTRADEIVRTAKASAPPSSSVVRLSEAQRVEQINRLADTGRTSDQIGAEIGVGEEQVRAIARRNDITITADELLRGRKRVRIDHNHVVNHLVATLEGLMTGLEMVDPDQLDDAQVKYWADSLTTSTRTLNRFVKQIKEKTQQ